ncbi:phosphatidylglycerophosphatase A [Litoreibacter ascidiaceicola]|uniref:Phosphatidylglycerophosphatase A n=1 Tax=Litoreibacter ascidiaceicola TaxID=1486859 RepID=A0A1M4W6Q1_9RHOB|nr:phosphatidylglycerophosphatase A [Litoreibacter ascidiaceicola]SHE76879.1 phosphatidylglycerophosphatase A [Litoreibacter ascidiaceicola]
MFSVSKFWATFFYVGLLRPAPGTWGSAAAVIAAWGIVEWRGYTALAALTVIMFVLGWYVTALETKGKDDHDPSEIVIDEVVGQWIALLPLAVGLSHSGASFWTLWPGVVTAFIAFRLFDIWKPGPVGWADRKEGPLGVMLDDVIAGLLAAIVVAIGAWLAHG